MREMKDSGIEWIGEIPADWTLQRGKTIFAQRLTKGNQSEILLAATQKYGMLPQSEVEGVVQVKEDADLQQFRTVHKKDFVISLRSFQGGFEYSQYEGVCSPAYQVFYNTNPICHNYYRLLFKSDGFIQKMNSMTVGIREGKNIQYSDFANSLIPVPPINQQQRIADYLDRKCSQIDTIIARQQEVIEKLKAYKLSVITEAVTKGLNPNVPMKDSGVEWIGEIPEHWTVSALRYGLENIQTGPFGSQLHAEDYIEDGIFVINPANIVEGCIVPDNRCSVTELKAQELSRHILNKGDIIFARRGEMGRCAYFGGSFQQYLCGTGCIKIQCNANLMPEFISWFLQTSCVKQYLTLNSVGTTMANLNTTIISGIPVVFPPISEQEKVVEYIKNKICEIDCVLKNKLSIVEKLTEYKKSLIYEVVTGKKEV